VCAPVEKKEGGTAEQNREGGRPIISFNLTTGVTPSEHRPRSCPFCPKKKKGRVPFVQTREGKEGVGRFMNRSPSWALGDLVSISQGKKNAKSGGAGV